MKYDDIINHKHYEPKHHPRMSIESRAAQFSPFAALTGFDKAINRSIKISELKNKRIIDYETSPSTFQDPVIQ